MDTTATITHASQFVAPEDLRVGDRVARLLISHEYPSFLWCGDDSLASKHEPVRITFLPMEDVGRPLKVLAICLPFVIVRNARENRLTIDVRTCRLGRLEADYVRIADKSKKKKRKKNKSKKKAK